LISPGLLRSILIYYGQPHKLFRLVRFYRAFVRPGDLCFDIGAHVGNRLWACMRLGARVVAVEPQPECMRLLKRCYGRNPNAILVEQAVGSRPGRREMLVSRENPTVASLSPEWIAAVQKIKSFAGVRWENSFPIQVTTLDALIDRYGEPAFCKIDVEGYELEVLRGLSRPLRALSFEYIPAARDLSLHCLERLNVLGNYEYNWSERESHHLHSPEWLASGEMAAFIAGLSPVSHSGDVYARLKLKRG
jgi:FkbM family methyltransferase